MPRALLYHLLHSWATDPHYHPRPRAQASKKGAAAMSDRFAAPRPPAIRNRPARTRRLTIGAAAAITIGAAVAIPALLAAPAAHPGNAVLAGHSGPVFAVAFSPDGKILASAGDRSMRLWDMATRRPIGHPLTGHTGGVISVAFSPDGKTLAGGGAQGVRLWDVGTGHQIRNHFAGQTGPVSSVAFSPDSKTPGHRRRRPWRAPVGSGHRPPDRRSRHWPHRLGRLSGVQPGRQDPGRRRRL